MCCARGTTSACAENTGAFGLPAGSAWNYLRVRGEYLVHRLWLVSESELPPRARRIHCRCICKHTRRGTTSACAENTLTWGCFATRIRNYLRVRGEYEKNPYSQKTGLELPPRARRIRMFAAKLRAHAGTTSACAENTNPGHRTAIRLWNYLRVRGEYATIAHAPRPLVELPPRARRIRYLGV